MDTVSKHRKKLLTPYKRSTKADEAIASAKRLALLILSHDELLYKHRKKMLSEVLWLISEADGKYSTRYRSKEVVRLAREVPDCEEPIHHEHVNPRKKVTEFILSQQKRFLKHPRSLEKLLDETVGCVVTRREHDNLMKSGDGWERYKNVPVLDMSHTPPRLRK